MKTSILSKLLIYIILPLIIILIAEVTVNIVVGNHYLGNNIKDEMKIVAENYTTTINGKLEKISSVTNSVANFLSVSDKLRADDLFSILEKNVSEDPIIYGAAIAFEQYRYEKNKRLFCPYVFKSSGILKRIDIGKDSYDYTNGNWQWYSAPKKLGKPIWTEPYFDKGAGNIIMCTYSIPTYKNGSLYAVVTVDVALPTFENIITNKDSLLKSFGFIIVSKKGNFIYHPDQQKILHENIFSISDSILDSTSHQVLGREMIAGKSGALTLKMKNSDDKLLAFFSPIPISGWSLGVYLNEQDVYLPLRTLINRIIFTGIITIVLMIIIVVLVSRQITNPLRKLREYALGYSDGNPQSKFNIKSKDEIGDLSKAFDKMLENISFSQNKLKNTLAELTASEERLRLALITGGIGTWESDLTTGSTRQDAYNLKLFNVEPSQYKNEGDNFFSLVHPEDIDKLIEVRNKTIKDGSIYAVDFRSNPANGQIKYFTSRGQLVKNDRGEPVKILGVTYDITERMLFEEELTSANIYLEQRINQRTAELKDSETKIRTVLETVLDVIVTIDERGVIQSINQVVRLIFGYSQKELKDKNVNLLLTDKYWNFYSNKVDTVQADIKLKKGHPSEIECKRKDGSIFPADILINGYFIKGNKYYTAVIRDITERKKYEEKNKQALEREHELNELKSRFISIVSHELRTPLSSILSSAELIERYGKKWSDEKYREQISVIKSSVDYLTEMMNDILTISRVENKKINFNPVVVDLKELCLEILEGIEPTITDKHSIVLDYQIKETEFLIDSKLVKMILQNILSNAVKYSPDGGEIKFSVFNTETEIMLKISDEGIGIPEDDLSKLFVPFSRASNTEEIIGTGLGLTIVKGAVEQHNGRISLKSKLNKGTEVLVVLPINKKQNN